LTDKTGRAATLGGAHRTAPVIDNRGLAIASILARPRLMEMKSYVGQFVFTAL